MSTIWGNGEDFSKITLKTEKEHNIISTATTCNSKWEVLVDGHKKYFLVLLKK